MGTSRTDRAVVESANRVGDLLKSFPTLWLDEIIKIRFLCQLLKGEVVTKMSS